MHPRKPLLKNFVTLKKHGIWCVSANGNGNEMKPAEVTFESSKKTEDEYTLFIKLFQPFNPERQSDEAGGSDIESSKEREDEHILYS